MLFVILITGNYCYRVFYIASIPKNISVRMEDNNVKITYSIEDKSMRNKIYYLIKEDNIVPTEKENDEWVLASNNLISYDLDKYVYHVFLKNEDDQIFSVEGTDKFGSITTLEVSKKKIYLPIGGSYNPTITFDGLGFIDDTISWTSSNNKIASVNEKGTIKALANGKATITAKMMNKETTIDVVVSRLITVKPQLYDYKKPYLTCDLYSKDDNDLMDEILKDRINDAGYKTRAGAVEAARFLTMEFPYRIYYFSENGRLATNGVDSEGRYYHVGLYLHPSRFANVGKRRNGPATWGCYMYSGPAHGKRRNGLDCSGFISWVLLNGGFDVKDVGAGLASGLDLTDYGKRTKFTKDLITDKKVKVGDLLSSGGPGGGHIAIIAGEDDKYFYVAESLWTPPNVGVVMVPYSKDKIYKEYYWVMLMDDYYKKDGNLTKMWY